MGQFIGEALESVGAQTYSNWEVIVVDDAGPEDGTRAAVEAFAAKHPANRVEYIRHEKNQGVSVARRTAFEASCGEYIAFLDADDAFLPEKMSEYARVLNANKECVLAHGQVIEICEKGSPLQDGGYLDQWKYKQKYVLWETKNVLDGNLIFNSTVICRRDKITTDLFPENLRFQFEDWLLWLLLAEKGSFIYVPKRLTRYRRHNHSFTSKNPLKSRNFQAAYIEMLLALLPRLMSPCKRYLALEHLVMQLSSMMWDLSPHRTQKKFSLPKFRWCLARASAFSELKRILGRLREKIILVI